MPLLTSRFPLLLSSLLVSSLAATAQVSPKVKPEAPVAGKQYEVPSFLCGDSVVWGATSMIVAEMFGIIGLEDL